MENKIDISNLKQCMEITKNSWVLTEQGPPNPTDYRNLREKLHSKLGNKLPPLYREMVFNPFVGKLEEIGEVGFNAILLKDSTRKKMVWLCLILLNRYFKMEKDIINWQLMLFKR